MFKNQFLCRFNILWLLLRGGVVQKRRLLVSVLYHNHEQLLYTLQLIKGIFVNLQFFVYFDSQFMLCNSFSYFSEHHLLWMPTVLEPQWRPGLILSQIYGKRIFTIYFDRFCIILKTGSSSSFAISTKTSLPYFLT